MPISKSIFAPPWANHHFDDAANILNVQAVSKNPTVLGSVIENENYRARLVQMRLRLREGETMPYQYFATALAGDKVFVFIVQDNQAVTLQDEAAMFPSDVLITQLRLLEK